MTYDLSHIRMLSFDTYGTLIDWEGGIATAFSRIAPDFDRGMVLECFARCETHQEATYPGKVYSTLLADTAVDMAQELGVKITTDQADAFGHSVKDWPAFEDAARALATLKQRFLMVTLTNCDRVSYMGSNARLRIEWDGIYTAQDVGSYKPSDRNFDYLLRQIRQEFGILPHECLHVAQSLTHDMVPATRAGLQKIWINRRFGTDGYGATLPPAGDYSLEGEYASMANFVTAIADTL